MHKMHKRDFLWEEKNGAKSSSSISNDNTSHQVHHFSSLSCESEANGNSLLLILKSQSKKVTYAKCNPSKSALKPWIASVVKEACYPSFFTLAIASILFKQSKDEIFGARIHRAWVKTKDHRQNQIKLETSVENDQVIRHLSSISGNIASWYLASISKFLVLKYLFLSERAKIRLKWSKTSLN